MRQALRSTAIAGGIALALALGGSALAYALPAHILQRKYPVPVIVLTIAHDPQSLQEGHRLAILHGCLRDCHGKSGEGRMMFDEPKIAQIVARRT